MAVGAGITIIFKEEETAEQGFIPVVVKVKIVVPVYPSGGVQVAFKAALFGVKVPPEMLDQIPPVAEPPIVPEREVVVPSWQMV